MLEFRGRHQYSDQRSNRNSFLRGLHRSGDRGGGEPNGQIVSIKRATDGRRQRGLKIINEERKKDSAKNGTLRNTSMDSKGAAFVTLKNHASRTCQKGKIESNEQSKKGGQPNGVGRKGRDARQSQKFREIYSREDRPTTRPGFVKPIQSGLEKNRI